MMIGFIICNSAVVYIYIYIMRDGGVRIMKIEDTLKTDTFSE